MRASRLCWVFFLAFLPFSPLYSGDVFSWRQAAGQTLRVMLNRHPYSEGIRRRLNQFESLTGIKVAYAMYPEDSYFQHLDDAFGSGPGQPDVYMIGAYQVWEYAPEGRMEPLGHFLDDPARTRYGYAVDDFFPNILDLFRWNCKAGSRLGQGPLWAVPMGFEICSLVYNREVLAQHRLPPPRTLGELHRTAKLLRDFGGEQTYGLALRGRAEWNSIHSAYITAFVNAGARDFEVEDGRLVSRVNSPEAVEVTEQWVRLLKECCPEDWSSYDWYRCLADIGNRKAAMIVDADIVGYFANVPGASPQAGKLGLLPPPVAGRGGPVRSNLWAWGLAINPASPSPDAAWLFLQYFTSREFQLYSVLEWKSVNPPRRSVFQDPEFAKAMASLPGYLETFSELVDKAEICFTPQPRFFAISRRWAEVIIEIATGGYPSAKAGLDDLKIWMDAQLADVEAE